MGDTSVKIMFSQSFNVGDFCGCWFAPLIAGRPGIVLPGANSLAVVGSILHWNVKYNWGPGFIAPANRLGPLTKHVFALRGPVSRAQALASPQRSAEVPPVYGDLGSLASWYYQPHEQRRTYNICFIPHMSDGGIRTPFMRRVTRWPGVRVISIFSRIFDLMDQIVRCEFVFSSTMHGLIFSDSYDVPNAHMFLTDTLDGQQHKFKDYFASVGRPHRAQEWVGRRKPTHQEVLEIVQRERAAYRPSVNLLPFWRAAPMHAAAYNRTRAKHFMWSRKFASHFTRLLRERADHTDKEYAQFAKRLKEELPVRRGRARTGWRAAHAP